MKKVNRELSNYKLKNLIGWVFCIITSILFAVASELKNEILINAAFIGILITGAVSLTTYYKYKK